MSHAYAVLPAPSGGDDTAALNAALAVGGRHTGQGGVYQVSAPLVLPSGTTLDMTGCTVQLLPGSDCHMVENAAVQAGGRDADIAVVGGTWARGSNAGVGNDRHSLFFRRVDRLTVRNLRVTSTAGKYAVAVGDATAVRVRDLDFDTVSDGVHITGPARDVDVRCLTGITGDDMMALTGRDYAHYDDVRGDIEGVTVDGIYPRGSLAAFKLISGTGTAVRGVSVTRVYGSTTIRPISIQDDGTGPTSVSGLTIADVDVQAGPTYPVVWLRCTAGRDITLRDVRVRRPLTTPWSPVVLVDAAARLESLTVDGLFVDVPLPGPDLVLVTAGAQVGTLRLARTRAMAGMAGGFGVRVGGGGAEIGRLLLVDYRAVSTATVAVSDLTGSVGSTVLRDVSVEP